MPIRSTFADHEAEAEVAPPEEEEESFDDEIPF